MFQKKIAKKLPFVENTAEKLCNMAKEPCNISSGPPWFDNETFEVFEWSTLIHFL